MKGNRGKMEKEKQENKMEARQMTEMCTCSFGVPGSKRTSGLKNLAKALLFLLFLLAKLPYQSKIPTLNLPSNR